MNVYESFKADALLPGFVTVVSQRLGIAAGLADCSKLPN